VTVCLLTIEDGRTAVHDRARASLREMLPDVDHHVAIDDRDHRLGFAGAIREGWRQALATDADWVWHAELDFIYHAPVPLGDMIALLKRRPALTQVALKRQPVNEQECAAGGIVEANPNVYREHHDDAGTWTTHRVFWTTNPSVYPRWIMQRGWPQCAESEGHFGLALFGERPEWCSCFWGAKYAAPMVEHIGQIRTGTGY
jgi:hypothetical protein